MGGLSGFFNKENNTTNNVVNEVFNPTVDTAGGESIILQSGAELTFNKQSEEALAAVERFAEATNNTAIRAIETSGQHVSEISDLTATALEGGKSRSYATLGALAIAAIAIWALASR